MIKELVTGLIGPKLIEWVDENLGAWDNKMPEPYKTEIASIIQLTRNKRKT